MSQGQIPDYALNYRTASPYGNAPMLVKLAGIFNVVWGGLSILMAAAQMAWDYFMHVAMTSAGASSSMTYTTTISGGTVYSTTAPFSTGAPMPGYFRWLFLALYGGAALLSLITGTVEIIGGACILRRSTRAFAWAIASVAASAISLPASLFGSVCCFAVVLPLGTGIYTLVVICLDNCRRYLRNQAAA